MIILSLSSARDREEKEEAIIEIERERELCAMRDVLAPEETVADRE